MARSTKAKQKQARKAGRKPSKKSAAQRQRSRERRLNRQQTPTISQNVAQLIPKSTLQTVTKVIKQAIQQSLPTNQQIPSPEDDILVKITPAEIIVIVCIIAIGTALGLLLNQHIIIIITVISMLAAELTFIKSRIQDPKKPIKYHIIITACVFITTLLFSVPCFYITGLLKIGFNHETTVLPTETITSAPSNTPTLSSSGTHSPEPSIPPDTASYRTLKLGSTGHELENLVTELQEQGYYKGVMPEKYNAAVVDAVQAFQKDHGLEVDGIAGPITQHALFGTVPEPTEGPTMTLYAAEKIDWETGGINELWPIGANINVYDVKTGIIWTAYRTGGDKHVEAEPLTAVDTKRLCHTFGVTSSAEIASEALYQRRPLLVTIGTRTYACSLYGVPHDSTGDVISNNNFTGQVCIHFTNSTSHNGRIDTMHQQAIQFALENAPNGQK